MPYGLGMAPTQEEVEQNVGSNQPRVPSGRQYWGDIEYDPTSGKYYGRGTDIQLGTLTTGQMEEIRAKRQQRPEFQLDAIVRGGGLTPQERSQLTSAANRQLGREAEGMQQAYERNLAGAGGRQAGSSMRIAGNRLLGAQLDVQNRLNEIAVDRKQKALMTLLQLQEQRRAERQARNRAEQAQKMNIIGQIFGIVGRAGLAAVTGGVSEAFSFGSETPGVEAPSLNFQYDQTRYA